MADNVDATRFTEVDATQDSAFFIKFLDARTGIEGERSVKELVLAMLVLETGLSVLDVGCGAGDDAREIAGLVGPHGKVVGLDHSAAMVEESHRRAAESSLPVEFVEGDACDMRFPSASFDRARADRVFVHLEDPERALAEMVRVVKPGGSVVITDVDCGTLWLDSPHRETTNKVFASFNDSVRSPWVGRSLPRMFQEAGLTDVECTPRALRANMGFFQRLHGGQLAQPAVATQFAPGELDVWWRDLAAAEASGHFHYGFCVFTTVGHKA